MVYVCIKLRERTKRKLEELKNRMRMRGLSVSLQDIVEKLVELGFEEEDRLFLKLRFEIVEGEPMLKLLHEPIDWGREDVSLKIDEVLYGGSYGGSDRYGYIRSSEKR